MADVLSYRAFVMAMERVEQRLRRVTAALDAAGIRYAVIGGNAVAVWVSKADPAATRTTKDVDLLVNQADLPQIRTVIEGLGFQYQDLRRVSLFIDPEEPSRMSGVHLIWAGKKVRPSYLHAAPSVDEAVRDPEGFWVLDLPALVRMKLTSLRDMDRVHVADLLRVGMIDEPVRASLPDDLAERLEEIARSIVQDDE
ncbi:MAG: nucleotidyltransferase family protein [Planctomycetes bacterium]|nr:nucleotidyltransferase family protein [Planctomycetota bacterium]